ncbi:kp-43 peptidase [Stemphylium lycopersici]|uniref:Kp-43 peptidase n=1 Tax=Stemphylium lycopersici TaxID=183478 RepID=A0A364MRZ1_STELY|nr:kp-43 peptidase [Stemphylium lycopersici]RAR01320.1 kp-43 peptidase [Stemphylium lycopersici]RAR03187.1 kp-43 peptidase [Stemphylium lycopersici]
MADIVVNGNTLELSLTHVERRNETKDARSTEYIYLQGLEDLTNDQKAELDSLDVQILEYISDKTYLCRYTGHDLDLIRELAYIRIANAYHKSLKTSADLKNAIENEGPGSLFNIDLMLHKNPKLSPVELADKLVGQGIVDNENVKAFPESNKIRVTVAGSTIKELEKFDDVNRIEATEVMDLANCFARKTLGAEGMIINGTEFKGSNQIVAVADTGFDRGSLDAKRIHPAFKDKVKALFAVGRKQSGLTNDPHGHGTHVCGSIVGDGISSDKMAGGRVQGTAPNAMLIVQSLLTKQGGLETPEDLLPLLSGAYEEGARIHCNSWTSKWKPTIGQVEYNSWATSIDKFVYEHPDMIIVIAAGNNADQTGAGTQQIGSSSAAKNCITVGATLSVRPNNGRQFTPWTKTEKNPAEVATFSSRGPTKEGRIKPDVMAPGTAILSAASQDLPMRSDLRTEYGTSMDDGYIFMSGTSMATPLVAGCIAALREAVISVGELNPSAALVKALLVNGTVDIQSTKGTGSTNETVLPPPNGLQGFGRVEMSRSIAPLSGKSGCGFVDAGNGKSVDALSPNNRVWRSEPIEIKGPGGCLVVTMAYSDREGKLLQNDLNLIVIDAKGNENHGNVAGASDFDTQNNVEKVVWDKPESGLYSVIVEAVGGFTLLNEKQGFAAVWAML